MGTLLNRRRYMGGGGGYPADALMTIETNPEVLAVCYAQGWCTNDKYMTASEAAAVTDIGTVFKNNRNITHFEELEFFGITSLANEAFRSATKLKSLVLPVGLTSIGNTVFYQSGLERLVIKSANISSWGNWYNWYNVSIKYLYTNSQTSQPATNSSFGSLVTFEIGNNVRYIGNFSMPLVEVLNIPEGVVEIVENGFRGSSILKEVSLPSSITAISNSAFYNDSSIQKITILATTPPTGVTSNTFLNTTGPIYVPSASVNAYKAASGWSSYASRIQAIPT